MEPRELSRKKKILFSIVTICAFFLILEGIARIALPRPDPSLYEIHQDVITILGLPELNEVMVVDPDLFWALEKNLTPRRIQGTIKGNPVDFTVSTNSIGLRGDEPRGAPVPLRILAAGNSCTFGVGVDDDETWPARLEQVLAERYGLEAEVLNAGVPGYTSYQGLRYLEECGLDLEPDLVIASFGFNDADSWGPKGDREIAKDLAVLRWERLFSRSRFYLGLKRLIREAGARSEMSATERRERLLPEEFHETLLEMNELCASRRVPLIFLVWPYRKQKWGEAGEWMGYQPVIVRAAEEARAPVINLVGPFTAREEPLFVDHVHGNEAGCLLAAETIAAVMEEARVR